MAQKVLDAMPEGGSRRWATRAGTLHFEIDDAFLVAAESYVAAVAGDRWTNARLDQILDGGNGLGVLGIEKFFGRSVLRLCAVGQQRCAGHIVLHDCAENRGLHLLPVAIGLGD
jgi:hypothetical protein